METVDYTAFQPENQSREDESLLVKFYMGTMEDPAASAEAGHAVFRDVEYIDIRTPGSHDSVSRPARQSDIDRFPKHYSAFKQRTEMPVEGTPLTEWPLMTRSAVEELAFAGVKTVEQLASMPDSNVQNFRGCATFKRQAQEWLERAAQDAPNTKLVEELALRDAQIEQLMNANKELMKRIDALESNRTTEPAPTLTSPLDEAGGSDPEAEAAPRRRRRS